MTAAGGKLWLNSPVGALLAAAALVEAAAGFAAAACLARFPQVFERGTIYVWMFAAAALATGLADAALVPGWVWARGRFRAVPVLVGLVLALVMLALAVPVGVMAFVAVFALVGAPAVALFSDSGWVQAVTGTLAAVAVAGAAGATVGLGAALAQDAGRRFGSGTVSHARTRSHLMGGVAGLLLTVLGLLAAGGLAAWFPAAAAWLPLAALPLIPVFGGLPHNVLVLRDAVRGGDSLPDPRVTLSRAGMCATLLVLAGAGLLVTAL